MDINEAVALRIAAIGNDVKEKVIEFEVNRKIALYVQMIIDRLTEIDNINKELKKIKPDNISYDEDGNFTSNSFSKQLYEKRVNLENRIKKVASAITTALEEDNFDPIKNLGDSKSQSNVDAKSQPDNEAKSQSNVKWYWINNYEKIIKHGFKSDCKCDSCLYKRFKIYKNMWTSRNHENLMEAKWKINRRTNL